VTTSRGERIHFQTTIVFAMIDARTLTIANIDDEKHGAVNDGSAVSPTINEKSENRVIIRNIPKTPRHSFHERAIWPRLRRILRELRVDPRIALKKACTWEF
jgi:hypothetical protein